MPVVDGLRDHVRSEERSEDYGMDTAASEVNYSSAPVAGRQYEGPNITAKKKKKKKGRHGQEIASKRTQHRSTSVGNTPENLSGGVQPPESFAQN